MIDAREVERVARLARLRLSEAEVQSLRSVIGACLEHFAELSDVDASPSVPATDGGAGAGRPDEPGDDPLIRPLSANAPDWREDLFVVPRLPALRSEAED